MKSLSLLCLAALLLGLAGCETTGTTGPAAPAASATSTAATPPTSQKSPRDTVDQLPVQLTRMEPVYPFEARQAGITGYVDVVFTINKNGDVVDAVATTATYPSFIGPALACVSQWKFTPGMKNGHPVAVRKPDRVTFGLK